VASLRRSPAEPPGGDEQRGEGTDEPDRLDDERLKVLIAAEVHGGAVPAASLRAWVEEVLGN
jgi:hypothetical protein